MMMCSRTTSCRLIVKTIPLVLFSATSSTLASLARSPTEAALPPEIVIGRVAAHIHHAVDRAGAAQDLAARMVHAAAFELRLGLALEHPIDRRIGKEPRIADRHMDPPSGVVGARSPAFLRRIPCILLKYQG